MLEGNKMEDWAAMEGGSPEAVCLVVIFEDSIREPEL